MGEHVSHPSGWYRDPKNPAQARYFDGAQWTAHVRPIPARPSAAGAAPDQSSAAQQVDVLARQAMSLRSQIEALQHQLVETSEAMLLQEVGIYRYSHPLDTSAEYTARLEQLQAAIKASVKSGAAVATTKKWAINGSEQEGAKMVADFGKLVLRAYNNEVDNVLRTLKPFSVDAAIGRLEKLRVTIAKLGFSMKLAVTDSYHDLRVQELRLTADYLAKLAEEKEREREHRARLKEEEAVRREMEREREKLEKERTHLLNAAKALIAKGDPEAAAAAEAKAAEVTQAIEGVVQREANVRAGYVYVISNIGSFGPSVVKIGMTRRLEPMDRIRELGDASVPYRFDVHVLFFSDDAVGIETALHRHFADQRINLVNSHREYFFASPAAVKAVLLTLKGDVLSFVEAPEALEWHQSENSRRARANATAHNAAQPTRP